ncbi:MAG: HDOD domain-containing protein [Armatimonadetes bacterium]|nr:HDOD domain-containing protein [Armatimonadota bacterium]
MALSTDNRFLKKSIEKALRDLPALPTVVLRVIQETQKPDTNAQELERLIAADQALTMRVLSVVNSAYYGLSGQVSNLGQAIVILGIHQVRNLALSVAAIDSVRPKTEHQHLALKEFWRHSFGAACATQIMSAARRVPASEEEAAFVCGLVHDIGRLFLFTAFSEIYEELLEFAAVNEISVEDAEKRFLGFTHAEVGELMCQQWKLPEAICRIIGAHEGPFEDGENLAAYLVHAADALNKEAYDPAYVFSMDRLSPEAVEWLDFTEDQYAAIKTQVTVRLNEAQAIFGIDAA